MLNPSANEDFHNSFVPTWRSDNRVGLTGQQHFYRTLVEECNEAVVFAPLCAERFR